MLHFPHNLHWFAPHMGKIGRKQKLIPVATAYFKQQALRITLDRESNYNQYKGTRQRSTASFCCKCSKHLQTLHCIKFEYPWRDCRPGGEWGWRAFIFILMTVTPIYKNAHCERRRSFLKFFTNENELWYRERGGETNAHGVFAHTHGCALSNICLTQLRKVHGTTTHSPGPGGFLLTQEGDTAVSTNQWTTNKTPDPTMPVIVAL